jgi:CubicO group peptidase (beta-lactamase class C family)
MWMRLPSPFAVLLVAAAAQSKAPQSNAPPFDVAAAWRDVEAAFRAACTKEHVVGASLLVVRGQDEIGFAAFGDADREGHRPVDRDTIFHWASCTKTLTGIAAMQLRDRGRLRLEQPIVELVPELRDVHDPFGPVDAITIRHLLSHSAGFRGATWPWGGDQPWHPHEPTQWSQLVAMMPYTEVEFAPGSKFSYSNPGLVFVGRAIERLTGDDYEVYMEKNVLRPLGMQHSYFDVTPYHLQRFRSHSYAVGKDGAVEDHGPDFDTGITVSNGGLNAPLPDMARYLAFLLGAVPADSDAAHVLARSSLEEMWQPVLPLAQGSKESIGLCFFVGTRDGQCVVGHTGGQRDFVTFFYVHPASGTGALGAFNTSTAGPAMAAVRRACLEGLSLPLAAAAGGTADAVAWGSCRLQWHKSADGVTVVVNVPTGGHVLTFERAVQDVPVVDVELKLETPAANEVVAQARQDLTVDVPAKEFVVLARGERFVCPTLRVRIAIWMRGAQYFDAPAHELAATFALR